LALAPGGTEGSQESKELRETSTNFDPKSGFDEGQTDIECSISK
jgi:hypothetical protein